MGFKVYYRSTRLVAPAEADAIRHAARVANEGRTWLGCEPVHFFLGEDDGHLLGGSKPNFQPHPDDAAAAGREGLPDGTTRDVLDVLCQLSRDHGVDWALSHDHDPAVGFIRAGVCDDKALTQIEAFADLGNVLGELGLDGFGEFGPDEDAKPGAALDPAGMLAFWRSSLPAPPGR